MSEGRSVVAGEATLSVVATTDGTKADRDEFESSPAATGATLESLVREHSRLVYRIAYAVLRRHHDAEDATQETFLRVMRHSAKLAKVEEPKAWLARIAWHVAVDRSRSHGRQREIPLEDDEKPINLPSSDAAADETVQGTQLTATLEKLITALPPKLREPLLLSAIEEMSPREVASTLGINEAAVRSRVFRARQILKEKLAQFVAR